MFVAGSNLQTHNSVLTSSKTMQLSIEKSLYRSYNPPVYFTNKNECQYAQFCIIYLSFSQVNCVFPKHELERYVTLKTLSVA